jgi:PAS domain S-box-containing protein
MDTKELLEALPVNYYVIDIDKKEIIQSNDSEIAVGENCYKKLFNKDVPCNIENDNCICQKNINNEGTSPLIIEKMQNGKKEFYRSEIKKISEKLILATYTNVTEEYLIRKELKINTRRLERAEKLALFGYWEIDLKKKTMISTRGARDIYGVSEIEIPLEKALSIPLSQYRKPLDEELEKLISGEKNYNITFEIKRPVDGEIRNIHSIAEYRKDKNMVFGVIRDITEKVRAEKELNRTSTLLRTLIDNLPDAIYMKDANYRKIIANKRDVKNCGLERVEDVIGKTDFELFPKNIAEKYMEDDLRVIEYGETILNREETLPGKPTRWLLTSKIPLRNDENEIIGLVGIGHDITETKKINEELKAAKEKAEESDRLKSLFLANMSHEIRTPLNAILGFSNIICNGDVDKKDLVYYAQIIENSGHRLTTVIDDIIDISLIQSNQLKIEMAHFNIDELIREMLVFYQAEKSKKLTAIELKAEYCKNESHSRLKSDKNRIYQVLRNLIDNAFKFTEEGTIRFGCSSSNSEELVLYVQDSGIGIEEDKISCIFDTFRQVDGGTSRKYEGSGLGLAISSGIIERLGGKIWVNSEFGHGTVFYVSIPRNMENEDNNLEPESNLSDEVFDEIEVNESGVKRIVSFEDDQASIEYLKSVIGLLGYEAVNFADANEGISFLRENTADLVLMDVQLPGMNGYEATKIIKSEFPNLPVIIQTAYAMKGDREKAFQSGCDDYLSKPVLVAELKEKISRFVNGKNQYV